MKAVIKTLREALYAPLELCQAIRAPLPLQMAVMRLTVRFDAPLRKYLLGR